MYQLKMKLLRRDENRMIKALLSIVRPKLKLISHVVNPHCTTAGRLHEAIKREGATFVVVFPS